MKQTLATALEARGYHTLTAVQEAVSDPSLEGRDLLVSAQTGSGKTVGFGLALAETLLGDADTFQKAGPPLALVIAPTRELAMQVKRELEWLYAGAGVVMASCVGGMDSRDERRALGRGAHIVVATPGRLRDHIMRGNIDLSAIRGVVLDEADEMLDLGFREDLEFILDACPEDRRTLLFSATVPRAIEGLAKRFQKDAERLSLASGASQHADIEYFAHLVAPRDVENAIINVLRYHEAPSSIVFCNTRAMVARMATRLTNRGFSVVSLSGELSQQERTHALQAMRDGRARVCVATDVAARGIDLPNLALVVHAELPSNHETLLHRSGRTGRAGRKGVSALIVPPAVRKKADRILNSAKLSADWGEAPSAEAVTSRDVERMLADEAWTQPVAEGEAAGVEMLVENFDQTQLAAAYLRLLREKQTPPEDLGPVKGGKPEKRAPFGPSVWFAVSQPIEARRLMPMVCKAGNISRDDIGAIRTQDGQSFVEIKESSVEGFLSALDGRMEVDTGAELSRLESPPVIAPRAPRPPRGGKPEHRGRDKDRADRGGDRGGDRDFKPRHAKASTPKREWDDLPDERPKKPKGPKPGGRDGFKGGNKGGGKPKGGRPLSKREHLAESHEGAVSGYKKKPGKAPGGGSGSGSGGAEAPRKPRPANAGDPSASLRGKGASLAPKVGKANSKKNKARRAAAEATKRGK